MRNTENDMGNFQTDVLYMQALDHYPYDVEQCLEKLQYVLSNEDSHAGAHYLIGRIYHEQMEDNRRAKEYYLEALSIDHEFIPTYYYYASLLIEIQAFEEAEKVIRVGLSLADIDCARLIFIKGILFERRNQLKGAAKLYKEAKSLALNNGFRSFMDDQLSRIKDKRKEIKKAKEKERRKELQPLSGGFHSELY